MSPTLLQAKSNRHLLRKCCLRILPGFLPSLQHLGCSNHSKRHSAVSPHSLRETSVQTFPLTVHVTGPCIKVTCRHDFSLPAFRTGDYKLFTFEHPIAPDVAPLEITTQHVRKEGRNEGQGGERKAAVPGHMPPSDPTPRGRGHARPQAGAGRRGPALPPQCPGRLPQSWVTERQGRDGAGGRAGFSPCLPGGRPVAGSTRRASIPGAREWSPDRVCARRAGARSPSRLHSTWAVKTTKRESSAAQRRGSLAGQAAGPALEDGDRGRRGTTADGAAHSPAPFPRENGLASLPRRSGDVGSVRPLRLKGTEAAEPGAPLQDAADSLMATGRRSDHAATRSSRRREM